MISLELATLPARDPSVVEPAEKSKQAVNPGTPKQSNVSSQNIINHLHLMQSASHHIQKTAEFYEESPPVAGPSSAVDAPIEIRESVQA